jgi:hypothetical protein
VAITFTSRRAIPPSGQTWKLGCVGWGICW